MTAASRSLLDDGEEDALKFKGLTPKQANIFAWGWQPCSRFRYAACGRRFGKSFLAVEEIRRAARLAALRKVSPDNEIWYGAPTFKQAKRVMWRRLKRGIPRTWIDGKPNESECSITLKSGHVIRIVGLDVYDNLRGSGLYFFLGDEWADTTPEAWDEVIRPMLSTAGGHAMFIGTPKGFNHFYKGVLDGENPAINDTRAWRYTTLQGGNVPPAEVEQAKRSKDARTFRQEYEASFENYSGRVYYAFDRKFNVRESSFDPGLPIHVGMDFNVNPMSACIFQERADGTIDQVDEIIIPTSNTAEMGDEIVRRYGNPQLGAKITIYPDPAGAQNKTSALGKTDISILRDQGFTVIAMASHPLVRDRINYANGRFQNAAGERTLYIAPRCVKSIEARERHSYKEGTSAPDKTDGFDHLCEAGDYYLYTRFAYKPAQRTQTNYMGR
jgi:hypothetical protein